MLSDLTHIEWPWLRLIIFACVVPLIWCFLLVQIAADAARAPARVRSRKRN
ncbi:hypothetical protein [Terrarubrum flagellatum]|uniref:hypothetical protein n=1 Tax=Terrirubrum flagellatum TaxID=2895980 RepID=UPI0031451DA6